MQHLHRVAWAQRPVDQQRFRFDTRPIQRQRPGFPHATYIRQRLFDNHPADAVSITDFKDQVQIAIADLRELQRCYGFSQALGADHATRKIHFFQHHQKLFANGYESGRALCLTKGPEAAHQWLEEHPLEAHARREGIRAALWDYEDANGLTHANPDTSTA